MLEVNVYTANWDAGRHAFPALPALGEKVRVNVSCDGREWGELKQRLAKAGRTLDWSDSDGADWNIYVVVALAVDDA